MRIAKIEDLHCNAGWRDFSFLKITTDDGLVGWSEFMENFGAEGLSGVIGRLGERIIGMDPRPVEKITAFLHGLTRQTPYGINQQAIAAIENALVDIKARALGIPVYELLGGPVRDRLRLYWSHCGTWRVSFPDRIKEWTGFDPIRSLADVERAGAEVAARGFKGLKTNIMLFDGPTPRIHMPGFNGPGWPELNIDRPLVLQLRVPQRSLARQIEYRIDAAFQDMNAAAAQDEGLVYVYVPKKYQNDWQHFAGVMTHLFLDEHVGCVPVIDERGRPQGIVTKSDLVGQLSDEYWPLRTAREVMMPLALTLDERATLAHAASLMTLEDLHHVMVVSCSGALIGIVSSKDVVRWLVQNDQLTGYDSATR